MEIPIIEFRAYFHQTHVHTLKGTCVWISWGNILLLTLYDPICIILKWKKLLNLITSVLLLGYSIGIHQVIDNTLPQGQFFVCNKKFDQNILSK